MAAIQKETSAARRRPFKWWQIIGIGVAAIIVGAVSDETANTVWVQSILHAVPGLSLLMLLTALLAALYFMPVLIGAKREISTVGPLFAVNFLFGWTLVGWLFCLLWAATGATKAQDEFYRKQTRRPDRA